MPRHQAPARLWLRPAEHDAAGRLVRRAQWIIKHGGRRIGTGLGAGDGEAAEIRLAAYIAAAHQPDQRGRDAASIPLADVIGLYLRDVVARQIDPAARRRAADRSERLLRHFGALMLADVNGVSCRAYRAAYRSDGGARRDLQDLSAAIQHHHREGLHREAIRVWLPPRGQRRERYLTRSEIARLVLTCWRMRETMRRVHADSSAPRLPTGKRTMRHLARAILFAYYTGSRPGDALRASYLDGPGRSFVDIERGVYHRLPRGKAATRKRQLPVRLGARLLAHLRRWRASSAGYVVEWEGAPVASVKTALRRACDAAGLPADVSLYTLRHSRATQLMATGQDEWAVAGLLATSPAMIRATYGHHSPDFQADVANAR